MRRKLLGIALFLLISALNQLYSAPRQLVAQSAPGKWSEPTLLLKAPTTDIGTNPIVYTSPSNRTYLLYFGRPAEEPNGPIALYYARWEHDAWTRPIDVLVTPDNALPPTLAAVEDSKGYLHVIWNTNAIWHTKVHVSLAANPQNWQTPEIIYGDKDVLEVVGTIDADDDIHVIASTRDRTVEYIPLSAQSVATFPVLIHRIPEEAYFPYKISMVMTASNRILTCWAEIDYKGSGARGVWCSRSNDKGRTWSAPEKIATGHRGARLVYFPRINQIGRIIWGGLGVGGRYLQLSDDDGETWSSPIDLTQGVHMEGYTGQVAGMDSSGVIHALINPGDGKYVHIQIRDKRVIGSAPTGWQASDWMEMAVARGNTLVVAFWAAGNTYTSHVRLNAPQLEPLPVPPPADLPQSNRAEIKTRIVPTATPFEMAAATTTQKNIPDAVQRSRSLSQITIILLGVIPALAVVVSVIFYQALHKRSA